MKKNLFLAATFVAGLITMGVAQLPSNNSATSGNLNYMALDTVPKKDTVPENDSSANSGEVSLVSFNSYMAKDTVPKKDTVPGNDSSAIKL
jgi:hypothetical protein